MIPVTHAVIYLLKGDTKMATNTSNASATAYKNTYTTFSGCDIVASFGATIIGEK